MKLKRHIATQLPHWRERVQKLLRDSGEVKVDDVTISQVYGGMRDVKCLVTDISYVDPVEGIRLRGYTIPELLARLPKPPQAEMPYAGGLYYLLVTGEIPTLTEALEVEAEWKTRNQVPAYIYDLISAMPGDTHPMTLFSQAILGLQHESIFAKKYRSGMKKDAYWEVALEDSLNLTAKLPPIAAYIYHHKYNHGETIPADENLDWAGNFANMMGIADTNYQDLTRLFVLIHSDHESGNVSAHTTHLVASALSDIYYASSAGLNGLAGPLHGLANQENLRWLLSVFNHFNRVPTREELGKFVWDTLNQGKLIPGYGHAVLRKTDPRFIAKLEFGKRHMPNDDIFKLASLVYEVVPEILIQQGKVKDPWPNVDAISGVLQYHYGIKELEYYTVLFGMSRLLGVTANVVWARALGQPIERPKSMTTAMLEEIGLRARSR